MTLPFSPGRRAGGGQRGGEPSERSGAERRRRQPLSSTAAKGSRCSVGSGCCGDAERRGVIRASELGLARLSFISRFAMSLPAKRCGRPPVLSFLEKKKRKQSLDRRRGKTRIYVGNHIDRWLTLKEKLDFRNDAEVAGFLLDLCVDCRNTLLFTNNK